MTNKKILKKVVCHDTFGKNSTIPTKKLIFRPSVYGIIIKNNKILLSRQFGGYDFPGGGIELGETLEDALKREVWEETGVSIKMGKLINCKDTFFKTKFTKEYWHCILMYYVCNNPKGELSKENFDKYEQQYADLAEWIPLDKVGKIKFFNSVDSVKIIKMALKLK